MLVKILLIIVVLLLPSVSTYSQDSSWVKKVIDENLTVSFPGIISEYDTLFVKDEEKMFFKTFKNESLSTTLLLIVTPNGTNVNADNKETHQKALEEMSKGSLDAMEERGLTCQIGDTIIDNIQCKKIVCDNSQLSIIRNYIFLVNDKMYSFQSVSLNFYSSDSQSSNLNKFLNSIHFNKNSIKEQRFGTKAESIAYNIGKLIIPLIILVGVIIYVVRKL